MVRNKILDNGTHDVKNMWADGITVHDARDSVFKGNEFRDNTDIDLIFGGCQRCRIQLNSVTHTARYSGSAYVGLMIQAWPSSSGDYTDSVIARNRVDCGPSKNCGFGIYIGSSAWYASPPVKGGRFESNVVLRSQTGLVIDDVDGMRIGLNEVAQSGGGRHRTSLGEWDAPAIIVTSKSRAIIEGGTNARPAPNRYTKIDVTGRIPNYSVTNPVPEQEHGCSDPVRYPFPHYSLKNGRCLKSCGALGGKHASEIACETIGRLPAGDAYDVPFCCQ
jgi:hypothetical protein